MGSELVIEVIILLLLTKLGCDFRCYVQVMSQSISVLANSLGSTCNLYSYGDENKLEPLSSSIC